MSILRKTSRPASPHWPRHALGRACLLALAGFGTVAWAQTSPEAALSVTNASLPSTETNGAVWSVNYGLVTDESQFGSGMLDASNVGVLFESDLSGGGVSSITVSNNTLQSLAFGNQRSSSTGLSLLTSSLLSMNLQSLSGLIQPADDGNPASMGSLSVSATVSGSSAFINQDGMASADLALSNNTLVARTQLNVADLRVEGTIPAGFASMAQGSSEVTLGATGVSIGATGASPDAGTTGTVNLSNLQSTFSASPSATVDTSGVRLTVSGTPIEDGAEISVFGDDASVSGNTLSASTGINTATSLFTADATSAAWTGSVSVTNLQNAAAIDTTTDSLASVSGSAVTADLRIGGTGGQTDLTGSLTLNDNQISASSTGNSAGSRTASGAISAGNAITFEGGADITGSASGTGTTVNLDAPSSIAASAADLTLANAQANAASSFVTSVSQGLDPLDSSGVISTIDNLAGGTLTQSGNAITASSTANLAGNLVSAGQAASVANFNGSVAALNVQSNTTLNSTASVESSAVSAVVGLANAVPSGNVTLSDNTLAATAEGNLGVTTVALKAANLNVSGDLVVGTQGVSLNPTSGDASAGLGVVALSVQSNEGGSLTANNEGTAVSLDFNNQGTLPASVAINGIAATLADNQLNSTATANSASTSATLEGTNGAGLSAAVGNSQRNVDMMVSANAGTISPLAVSLTSGAVTGSTLTLTGNDLNAAATGNSAANRLNVSLETASGSALLTAAPQAASTSTTSAVADLALANSQLNDNTDLTAAVAGAVSMDLGAVGSVASPSAIALSANQIGASAEVNRASNAMVLDVGQMTGMNSALASRQESYDSAASASTAGSVTLNAGDAVASTLTANLNTVKSSVLGNAVNNSVSVTGTSATGSGVASTAASASATGASTSAGVSLANAQISTRDALSALTGESSTPVTVTMDLGAVSGASALNLNGTTLGATTSVNSASNALSLEIITVTGMTSGVASAQALTDSPAEAITYGLVDVNASSVTGSIATVKDNAIEAAVFGNSAENSFSLDAAEASGLDVSPSASIVATSTAAGDFVVANNQSVNGTAADVALSSITSGNVQISAGTSGALTSSALTLSKNSVSAYTSANSANNEAALNVTDLSAASTVVASSQVIDSAGVSSVSTGAVRLEGGAVTDSALTLSGNTVKSTSLGNVATNQVSLAGTNATGSSAAVSTASSATAGTSASAVADVALANLQDSSNITLSATTVGSAGITVGAVGPQTGANSALTLSDNTISALAQSNSASNTLALASTNLNGMSAGVASSQRTVGTVEATVSAADPVVSTSAAFLIDAASATSTPVVLSNNTFSAVAGMNEAFNTLTAEGAVLLGRGSTTDPTLGVASTTGVDFSVVNAQSGEGAVSALADPGTIGFTGALTGGSLSIAGNTVLARASVNTASNQLTLAATNRLEATAAVNNVQNMDRVVSATVVESTIEPSLLGANLDAVGGASTVSVSDNRVTAQATGNIASNALNATAVSGISSSGSSVQPTFAVLNSQTTQATGSIDAVLNGTTLGATLNGTGGSTSVQGNQMVALAYGNSVDNVIGMSALPGGLNTASAAITSVQYNMASISATVSGVSMVGSGTVSGTGAVNVSGNTVTAQVVGNRSVSSIAAR